MMNIAYSYGMTTIEVNRSSPEMGNMLSGLAESSRDSIEQVPHGVSPIEHTSGLLIALHVILYLPKEFLVDAFVLDDLDHQ